MNRQSLYRPFKRLADIVVSAVALVVLSPVLAVVALLVLSDVGSPVLFRQTRPGKGASPFTLYKFRTMRGVNDGGLAAVASDDTRVTAIGRLLRRSSLDELPELFNVLKGDMSFVGPRPMLMEYVALYTPEQARRHEVTPGLTGLAQVSGRNALSWERRFALDVEYVDSMSPLVDLAILGKTVSVVLSRRGADGGVGAELPPFTGSRSEVSPEPPAES